MKPRHSAVVLVGVIWLVAPSRLFVAALAPAAQRTLGSTTLGIGLISSALSIGYICAAVPLGSWIDRGQKRWAFVAFPLLTAGALLMAAFSAELSAWLVASVIVGAAWGGVLAGGNRQVAIDSRPAVQGRNLGILQTGIMASSAVVSFILPWAAATWTIEVALIALAALALAAASVALQYSPSFELGTGEFRPHAAGLSGWNHLRLFLLYGVVMGSAIHCAFAFLNLTGADGSGMYEGASLFAFLVGGMVGPLIGGRLLDVGLSAGTVLVASTLVSGLAAMVIGFMHGLWIAGPAFVMGIVLIGHTTVFLTAGLRSTHRRSWARVGAMLTTSHVVGGVVGPPLFGWLADAVGGFGMSWVLTGASLLISAGVVTRSPVLSEVDSPA